MDGLKFQWIKVKHDVNGNPRYVCHFLNFIKDGEFDNLGTVNQDGSVMTSEHVINLVYGMSLTSYKYQVALKRAHKLGGKKFHNKQYGGGIVFQSYNLQDTERSILELLEKESK